MIRLRVSGGWTYQLGEEKDRSPGISKKSRDRRKGGQEERLGSAPCCQGPLFCLPLWFCIFLISKSDSGSAHCLCRLNRWLRFLLLRELQVTSNIYLWNRRRRQGICEGLGNYWHLHFTDVRCSAWKGEVLRPQCLSQVCGALNAGGTQTGSLLGLTVASVGMTPASQKCGQ